MADQRLYEHDTSKRNPQECACCEPSGPATRTFRSGRAYRVRGLDCAEEVAVLKQAVGPLVGGADRLAFDVLNGRMTVADDTRNVPDEAILKAVGPG
jgi:Cd2+/Zn2+-exporting ATPase